MAIEHIGIKNFGGTEEDVAVDAVGTDKYQVVKLGLGADGALDNVVDAGQQTGSASVPVVIASDQDFVKTRDGAVGATDKGIPLLARHQSEAVETTFADGDYDVLSLTPLNEVRTRDQRAFDIQSCNVATDWTALNNDTDTIADSVKHVFGTGAVSFNKANGAANTVFACIQDTIPATCLSEVFEAGGFVGMGMYIPSLTNVVSAFLRLGTDASHYQQFTWPVASLIAATWLNLRTSASTPDYANCLGNGWDPSAITYVAVGVQFNSESATLTGIVVDHIHAVGGRITAADTTNISTLVNTANVNINKISGASVAVSNGTAETALRVTLASDSTGVVALSATDNTVLDSIDASLDLIALTVPFIHTQTGTIDTALDAINAKLVAGTTIGNVGTAENGKTRVSLRVAVTASQTGATVWDPTAGKKFVLIHVEYSATGAGVVDLFDATDSGNTVVTALMSCAANGGFMRDWPIQMPYRSATADNILKYTSGAGAAGSILVEGWEE
jgi:hypothetical protein